MSDLEPLIADLTLILVCAGIMAKTFTDNLNERGQNQ